MKLMSDPYNVATSVLLRNRQFETVTTFCPFLIAIPVPPLLSEIVKLMKLMVATDPSGLFTVIVALLRRREVMVMLELLPVMAICEDPEGQAKPVPASEPVMMMFLLLLMVMQGGPELQRVFVMT